MRTPLEHFDRLKRLRESDINAMVRAVSEAFEAKPRSGRFSLMAWCGGPCEDDMGWYWPEESRDEQAVAEVAQRLSASLAKAGWGFRVVRYQTRRWWRRGWVEIGVPRG